MAGEHWAAEVGEVLTHMLAERLPTVGVVSDDGATSLVGTGSVAGNLHLIVVEMTRFYQAVLSIDMSIFSDSDLLARHRAAVRMHGTGPERITERVSAYLAAEQAAGRVGATAPVDGGRDGACRRLHAPGVPVVLQRRRR